MIRRCAVLLLLAAGALRGATPPDDAGTPRAPEDLAVDLVLREPRVAQPVFLHFDARGRLWVVQYLQYPDPAGLRAVSRDSVWRVIYDERKPPPPYDTPEKARFRGRDRVSIFSDRDGDGSFETEHTFVDGLNITTAAVPGRGGVWVLSPPQLLFYPDADGDDTPDGPPVVKLDGFNLEDTHSVANSLRWGPDGWLYGAVGSTVSTEITRPGLDRTPVARLTGQGIWRYHPESARFEIFAEGGGNTFGVEIDAQGRVFSGHNGGNTRGFHYVQGGYHRKGFDKHGELSNPHAYGFFPAMPHPDVARFTHNFVIYAGGSLPLRYHGKLIGTDPMNNWLPIAELTPRGSTFATRDVDAAIRPGERRFRPVDIKHGPDGALYVADWRDLQVNHYRNHEGQITREDGRIYRLRAAGTPAGYAPFDLTRESSAALLALLDDPNRWRRETARQLLGDRRDASLLAPLRALLAAGTVGQLSLEALWALHVSGGFNAEIALTLLAHPDAHVRGWTVRLLGDEPPPGPALTRGLAELALREPNVEVRGQLAATARRLPTTAALPVLEALFGRDEDADDPYVPLQLWWALESKVSDDREAVTALLATASEHSLWSRPLVRRHLASRLMRRLAAGGSSADLQAAARLLNGAPDDGARRVLLEGFEQAFEGRPMPVLPPTLVEALLRAGGGSPALRVRQGSPEALQEGLARLADAATPAPERARLAQAFGEVPYPPAAAILARLVAEAAPALRPAILAAAAAYPDPAIPEALLRAWETLSAAERPIALSVLASRRASAEALLGAVAAGRLPARDIPRELQDQLRRVDGGVLAPGVDALYGPRSEVSAAEFEREIARVVDAVRAGRGSPYAGRELYARHCLACHRLHAKGGDLGPDLTPYPREDLANLVLNIVHPSAEIREGYEPFVITTKAGATHTGFLARQDAERVVLRDLAGISLAVERGQLAALRGLGRSLMPEGLLTGLSDGELRDLFAYLRTTQPLVGAETAATAAP